MDGRREQYRQDHTRPFLRAKLEIPGAHAIEASVLDLSGGGAGLLVEDAAPDALLRGMTVHLLFETLVLLKPIRISARIARLEVVDGELLCGLEFTDPSELDTQVPFVLRREFNRRATPRSRPDDLVEVLLESAGGDEEARARMVDISTGGVGLSLGGVDRGKFETEERVVLSFFLPGNPTQLQFAGRLRGRRTRGRGAFLNVEFDPRSTEDYEWQRSIVEEYVTERIVRSHEARRR